MKDWNAIHKDRVNAVYTALYWALDGDNDISIEMAQSIYEQINKHSSTSRIAEVLYNASIRCFRSIDSCLLLAERVRRVL